MTARHFLDLSDFSGADLRRVLDASADIKARIRNGLKSMVRTPASAAV